MELTPYDQKAIWAAFLITLLLAGCTAYLLVQLMRKVKENDRNRGEDNNPADSDGKPYERPADYARFTVYDEDGNRRATYFYKPTDADYYTVPFPYATSDTDADADAGADDEGGRTERD